MEISHSKPARPQARACVTRYVTWAAILAALLLVRGAVHDRSRAAARQGTQARTPRRRPRQSFSAVPTMARAGTGQAGAHSAAREATVVLLDQAVAGNAWLVNAADLVAGVAPGGGQLQGRPSRVGRAVPVAGASEPARRRKSTLYRVRQQTCLSDNKLYVLQLPPFPPHTSLPRRCYS